jgi:hypothetical protein
MLKICITAAAILAALSGTANAQLFQNWCGIFDPNCDRQNAADDAACRSYGAKPATPGYVQCRVQLKTTRDLARAAIMAAPDAPTYQPSFPSTITVQPSNMARPGGCAAGYRC